MKDFLKTISVLLGIGVGQLVFAAEGGFFGCDDSGTNCRLLKTTLADTAQPKVDGEPYTALFDLRYRFNCIPGGYDSKIVIHAGDTTVMPTLIYGAYQAAAPWREIQVRGNGPVTLHDTDPVDTQWETFGRTCGLEFEILSIKPAPGQVEEWLVKIPEIISQINLKTSLASTLSVIEMYYDAYISDPTGNAGFIVDQIKALRAPGASAEDLTKADALQKVIDGQPREKILAPFVDAFEELKTVYQKGNNLKKKLVLAQRQYDKSFDDCLDRAKAVVGSTN